MNRKLAREETYKLIFTWLFTAEKDNCSMANIEANDEFEGKDVEYVNRTFINATAHYDEIIALIAKYAKGYTVERIFKPDLAGMLLAIAEMKYDDTIPMKVSINESVEIVKKYSVAKSNSFVNGVLASVYKELSGEVQA